MESIDTKAFWDSMTMGFTAKEYVSQALEKVNRIRFPDDNNNIDHPENFLR